MPDEPLSKAGPRRKAKAATKYTPLREVLEGKRVILVEDSIVRSTTMNVLLDRIREVGGAKEIHVRVACPPIIAPCFYGIDMSTIDQLIAPKYFSTEGDLDGRITTTDWPTIWAPIHSGICRSKRSLERSAKTLMNCAKPV